MNMGTIVAVLGVIGSVLSVYGQLRQMKSSQEEAVRRQVQIHFRTAGQGGHIVIVIVVPIVHPAPACMSGMILMREPSVIG